MIAHDPRPRRGPARRCLAGASRRAARRRARPGRGHGARRPPLAPRTRSGAHAEALDRDLPAASWPSTRAADRRRRTGRPTRFARWPRALARRRAAGCSSRARRTRRRRAARDGRRCRRPRAGRCASLGALLARAAALRRQRLGRQPPRRGRGRADARALRPHRSRACGRPSGPRVQALARARRIARRPRGRRRSLRGRAQRAHGPRRADLHAADQAVDAHRHRPAAVAHRLEALLAQRLEQRLRRAGVALEQRHAGDAAVARHHGLQEERALAHARQHLAERPAPRAPRQRHLGRREERVAPRCPSAGTTLQARARRRRRPRAAARGRARASAPASASSRIARRGSRLGRISGRAAPDGAEQQREAGRRARSQLEPCDARRRSLRGAASRGSSASRPERRAQRAAARARTRAQRRGARDTPRASRGRELAVEVRGQPLADARGTSWARSLHRRARRACGAAPRARATAGSSPCLPARPALRRPPRTTGLPPRAAAAPRGGRSDSSSSAACTRRARSRRERSSYGLVPARAARAAAPRAAGQLLDAAARGRAGAAATSACRLWHWFTDDPVDPGLAGCCGPRTGRASGTPAGRRPGRRPAPPRGRPAAAPARLKTMPSWSATSRAKASGRPAALLDELRARAAAPASGLGRRATSHSRPRLTSRRVRTTWTPTGPLRFPPLLNGTPAGRIPGYSAPAVRAARPAGDERRGGGEADQQGQSTTRPSSRGPVRRPSRGQDARERRPGQSKPRPARRPGEPRGEASAAERHERRSPHAPRPTRHATQRGTVSGGSADGARHLELALADAPGHEAASITSPGTPTSTVKTKKSRQPIASASTPARRPGQHAREREEAREQRVLRGREALLRQPQQQHAEGAVPRPSSRYSKACAAYITRPVQPDLRHQRVAEVREDLQEAEDPERAAEPERGR